MPLFAPTPWHVRLLAALLELLSIEIIVGFVASSLLISAMVYGPMLVVKAPYLGAALLWHYVRSFRNPFRGFIVIGKDIKEFEAGCVAEMAAYNTKQLEEERRKLRNADQQQHWVDGIEQQVDGGQPQQPAAPAQPEASSQVPNGNSGGPPVAAPVAGLYARLAGRR